MAYSEVLYNTKSVPAASLAASRLAELAIRADDIPKAAALYVKILRSNPDYFANDIDFAKSLMATMADHKLYEPAALLAEAVVKQEIPTSKEYENALLALARWQNLGGMPEKSLATYNRYLKEYPYSAEHALAEKERDLLEFSLDNQKSDGASLALYDRILERYPADEAAGRALYKKAKLLLKLGKYREVAALMPKLDKLDRKLFHDFDQQMRQTERVLLDSFLRQNDCQAAIALANARKLGASFRDDDSFYECAIKERDYSLAVSIADENALKLSPIAGAKWSERKMDALRATGDYPSYIEAAERYMRMNRAVRNPVGADRYLQLFDAYRRTGFDDDRMAKLAEEFESRFPKDPRLMDIYAAMISLSRKNGDAASQYAYARKLVNRARLASVGAFTPDAETAFADAAIKLGKDDEAIVVLKTMLDSARLNAKDRARAMFALGELYEKKSDPAIAAATYKRCAAIDANSASDDPWLKLCKEEAAM